MSFLQVLVLSLVQGLTEFLPVSSSGHLVIFQKFFGLARPPVLFDILLHLGSLGAIVVYFGKDLWEIAIRKEKRGLIWLIVLGTIPAGIVGSLFDKQIEAVFDSLKGVGLGFIFTAVLLFSTKFIKNKSRQFNQLKWQDAITIGFFQAIAIFPGISRSGSTIASGLSRGLSAEAAFNFSFYLAVPAILGAFVIKAGDLTSYSFNETALGLIGMVISGIISYLSLRFLEKTLKSDRLCWFGIYTLILGIAILLV